MTRMADIKISPPALHVAGGLKKFSLILTVVLMVILLFFLIVLIVAIIVMIYRGVNVEYVRPFVPGHSEPFLAYMDEHVEFVNTHLITLRNYFRSNGGGGKLKGIISSFESEGLIRDDLDSFDAINFPFHHIYFAFRRPTRTESKGYFSKSALNMISKFYPSDTLPDEVSIYNESGTEISDDAINLIKQKVKPFHDLRRYYDELDCSFRGFRFSKDKCKSSDFRWCKCKQEFPEALSDTKAEMARLHLMLLIYKYAKKIDRGYNLRKSGGIGNFTIFNIYMSDYAQYVFIEMIQGSWKRYVKDFKNTGNALIGFFTKDSTRNFMLNLPARLAGSEGFVNKQVTNTLPYQLSLTYDDTEEHFIGVLKSIGKVFVDLGKMIPKIMIVLVSLVSVITNPLEFIIRLIGWIIGVWLLILYSFIVLFSPLLIGVAAIWVAFTKVLSTVIYTILFVVLAIVFFILWILDFATNGFILSILRCENLPNEWHERAGWAFGSHFKRQFFCHYPCHHRYYPDGSKCKRANSMQPSFCPQQHAFNIYIANLRRNMDHPSLSKGPPIYEFVPPMNYPTMSDKDKTSLLSKFFILRNSFKQVCTKELIEYDFIIRYMCKNMDSVFDNDSTIDKKMIRAMCQSCYCGHYYKDRDCKMKQRPAFIILHTTGNVNDPYHMPIDNNTLDEINKALEGSGSTLSRGENENLYYIVEGFTPVNTVVGRYESYPSSMPSYCNDGAIIGSNEDEVKKKGEILYLLLFMMLVLIAAGSGIAMLYNSTNTPVIVMPGEQL